LVTEKEVSMRAFQSEECGYHSSVSQLNQETGTDAYSPRFTKLIWSQHMVDRHLGENVVIRFDVSVIKWVRQNEYVQYLSQNQPKLRYLLCTKRPVKKWATTTSGGWVLLEISWLSISYHRWETDTDFLDTSNTSTGRGNLW